MTPVADLVFAEEIVVSYPSVRGSFGGVQRRPALRGATVRAQRGEVVALVGPNGAGKTTLFRALLGFLRPSKGRCLIGGEEPAAYRRRRGIAYLPEAVALPPGWKARDVLCRAVDLSVPLGQRRTAYGRVVAGTQLDAAVLARETTKCSHGTQKRLWLACALVGDPEVVLLDEPFAGLDTPARRALRAEVRSARQRGAAVLLASHELPEVERLADSVVVLNDGVTTKARRALPTTESDDSVAALEAAVFGEAE